MFPDRSLIVSGGHFKWLRLETGEKKDCRERDQLERLWLQSKQVMLWVGLMGIKRNVQIQEIGSEKWARLGNCLKLGGVEGGSNLE